MANFLGPNLKFLRKQLNLRQEQMGLLLMIDRTGYSCYELGKTSPSYENLIILAKFFNVKIQDLLLEDLETLYEKQKEKKRLSLKKD